MIASARTIYGPAAVTAGEIAQLIGCFAMLPIDHVFRVRVKIIDTRYVYGRTDALVIPTDGAGQTWVAMSRLTDLSLPK